MVSVSWVLLLLGVGSAPWLPSSATVAVLVMAVTLLARGFASWTVSDRVTWAPAFRLKLGQVTTPLPGDVSEPLWLALTKLVWAGRVSVTTTPVALTLPTLLITRV